MRKKKSTLNYYNNALSALLFSSSNGAQQRSYDQNSNRLLINVIVIPKYEIWRRRSIHKSGQNEVASFSIGSFSFSVIRARCWSANVDIRICSYCICTFQYFIHLDVTMMSTSKEKKKHRLFDSQSQIFTYGNAFLHSCNYIDQHLRRLRMNVCFDISIELLNVLHS